MKIFLPTLAVFLFCFICHLIAPSVKATLIFSDSFLNSYSNIWVIPSGTFPPEISQSGITGTSTNNAWSVLEYPITGDDIYQVQFDLLVNNASSQQTWGVGFGDYSNNWKIINTWQNYLQLHDSSNNDKLVQWDHSTGIHHFRIKASPKANSSIVIYEDDVMLGSVNTTSTFTLARIWVSFLGSGDYEMANFVLSTYEEPTPTPTPEPTVTPTPTPSPTLTPTPTPTLVPTATPTPTPAIPKKIVILHGAGGSWNKDALLNCKTTGYSGTWSPWKIKNADIYEPLITTLRAERYEVLPFYYDWRTHAKDSAKQLGVFADATIPKDQTFDVVAHSFGGIVSRTYIDSKKTESRVHSLLTVGTPHQGSVLAYPAWSAGEMWIDDMAIRLGYTMMRVGCAIKHGWSSREMVHNTMPATQNILPIFNYLKSPSGADIPVSQMSAKNNLLPDSFVPPYYGVQVGALSGSGYQTLRTLEVRPPTNADKQRGNWKDGKPTTNRTYADGDGTVLTESSILAEAANSTLPLDHAGLITEQTGIDAILGFLYTQTFSSPALNFRKQAPITVKPAKNTSALLIVADGAHISLTDKDGNVTADEEGQITVIDPHPQPYTLTVTPLKKWWWQKKAKIIVIQLFDDGTSTWKEYTHPGTGHRKWKLRFDAHRKNNDILRDK
jgi:pimeloyl-ACP methyl ester carboxylesterase